MLTQRAERRGRPITDEVAGQIESAVRDRLIGWVTDFRVLLRDRGMVLTGCTHSYYAKQLVQHLALTASRLPLVANEIQVV
jgi:hypothetical protein